MVQGLLLEKLLLNILDFGIVIFISEQIVCFVNYALRVFSNKIQFGRNKMNTKTNLKIPSTLLLLFMSCSISQAMFTMPPEAPIDRLIANTTAFIKEHPNDPNGYYILGRINYLSFSLKTKQINAFALDGTHLPQIADNWQFDFVKSMGAHELTSKELGYMRTARMQKDPENKYDEMYQKKKKEVDSMDWYSIMYIGHKKIDLDPIPDSNQLIQHVSEAMKYFSKAIDMSPNNSLYCLGYASLLEQYVNYLKEKNIKEIPEELRYIILEKAKDFYFHSYNLSIEDDLKSKPTLAWKNKGLTAYEAGAALIRLAEQDVLFPEQEKDKLPEIKENIQKLDNKSGAITPIIFSLEKAIFPADLLESNLQVNFNLDGNGTNELWPWVKPSTGILVWNEDGKDEITSGRQMFGSVTWWLFFNNGYHALDCLDDNRDGSLSGDELKGISIWFDTNSNGKSESGEIKSLDELGIVSISTKATSTENNWPANKTGIKLKNGQTISTYDWIATPIKE